MEKYWLNDVYDPFGILSGQSPTGFLEWMNIYERFRVHKSTIHVDITNRNAFAGVAALMPSGDSVVGLSIETAIDNPLSVTTSIPPNTSNSLVKLVRTCSTHEILGVPRSAIDTDWSFAGTESAQPVRAAYWYLYVQNPFDTNTMSIQLNVQLTFDVIFFRRKVIEQP